MCQLSHVFSNYRNLKIFAFIIRDMEENFKKYWPEPSMLFCLAVVMDPRIKLIGALAICKQIFDNINFI